VEGAEASGAVGAASNGGKELVPRNIDGVARFKGVHGLAEVRSAKKKGVTQT
jgi:hypothetical protein